jgi:hypothetical protein
MESGVYDRKTREVLMQTITATFEFFHEKLGVPRK